MGVCQMRAAVLAAFLPECEQNISPVNTKFSQYTLVPVEDASFTLCVSGGDTPAPEGSFLMHIFRVIFRLSANMNLNFQHL